MILKNVELEPGFHVGSQIAPTDIDTLKADGVEMIINNRPDGEVDDQPTSAALAAAARDAGLEYAHVPIGRGIGPADVESEKKAIEQADGRKTFAFCRSGTRSTLMWALAHHAKGRNVAEMREKAEAAGYSLDPVNHLL